MSLTAQQQAAASAPGSVAVMAGAGSGKTHLLVARYLHHLQTLSPLEIVAATFTEKAAAELRARIRAGVQQSRPGDLETLAELEAAQISTIHALCARIVRDHPGPAGVRPDAGILDAGEAALWRAHQLRPAVAALPARLFRTLSFSGMTGVLHALLDDPLLSERALQVGPDGWEIWAAQARGQAIHALTGDAAWIAAVRVLQGFSGAAGDRMETARVAALTHVAALAGPDPADALDGLANINLVGGSAKAWPAGNLPEIKAALRALRELTEAAQKTGLPTLAPGDADAWLQRALPDIREAYGQVAQQLTALKRRAGLLDFADIEVHALQALRDPAVSAHYHARWHAYLIDEAQDTNPVQAELLERLCGPACRTLVGDEKQSIYAFRRADPALFRSAGEVIRAGGGDHVALDVTFRTHQGLVDTTNHVFSLLLGPLHAPLSAVRAGSGAPSVETFTLTETKPRGRALAAEAAIIAERLRTRLDAGALIHDPALGAERPLRPGDIAVLTRGWAALRPIGRALAQAGIPVQEAGTGSLLDTQVALDGLNLLAAVALHDPAALVAVLRSPLCAASDPAIADLARDADGDWFRALEQSRDPRLERGRTLLAELTRLVRSEPPSTLLRHADLLSGYTAVLSNLWDAPRLLADWRAFGEVVRELERGDVETFGVVQDLRDLARAGVLVPRPALEGGDAVTLTTMHSSKGLEWPLVVVADLTWSPPFGGDDVLIDAEYGLGLKVDDVPTVPWTLIAARRQARDEGEARRLLYVALTRARDVLLLAGHAPIKRGTLYALLEPGLHVAGIHIEELDAPPVVEGAVMRPDPAPADEPSALWPDPVDLDQLVRATVSGPQGEPVGDWEEILDLLDVTWVDFAHALAARGIPAPSDVHVDLPVHGRVSADSALMLWQRGGRDILLVDSGDLQPGTPALTVRVTDDPDAVAAQLRALLS